MISFRYQDFFYSAKNPNNCVMLKNGNIVLINRIKGLEQDEVCLFGTKLDVSGNVHDEPTKSSDLNVHLVTLGKTSYDFFLQDIECKAVFLSIFELEEDQKIHYVLRMLH